MKHNIYRKFRGGLESSRSRTPDANAPSELARIPLPDQAAWQARQDEVKSFLSTVRSGGVVTIPVPEGRTPESIQEQITWLTLGNGPWITSHVSPDGKSVVAGTREALELWEAA